MSSPPASRRVRLAAGLAAGGLLGALAATSCCILPLALFGLGASGAWLGNLAALSPYQPAFVAVSVAMIAAGFWTARRRRLAAGQGGACGGMAPCRLVRVSLWAAAVLVAAAAAFPFVAPAILGV